MLHSDGAHMKKTLLAALSLAAFAPFCTASAEQDETKWSAVQWVGPQRDCSGNLVNARWSIVEKAGVLTATSDGVASWHIRTRGLNPDGSGRVDFKDSRGRPVWFEFEPGRGPRKIRFNFRYRACVWLLNPV
jgi:hypothetical protein